MMNVSSDDNEVDLEQQQNSIVEDRRMLSNSKSSKCVVKSNDISLQHLTTLNSFLDGQLNQTQYITKEINNEIALSHKNQSIVGKTICKINCDGESLARRYEEEKERNEKLQFLVKHIESEILAAKMEKANDLKSKVQTDKLLELTGFLTERERELEKVCEKTNTASYQLSKKMDAIRALRSERAIFSSLFDKLQRQLCNLQHCYKVLVIEHKIEDRECEVGIQQFNKCETVGSRKLDKAMSRSQIIRDKRQETQANTHGKSMAEENRKQKCQGNRVTVNMSPSECGRQKEQKQRQKGRSTKFQNDLSIINREKKIKLIFNQLGVSSIKDIPDNLQQLDQVNQRLLRQNQEVYQAIEKTQGKLLGLVRKQKAEGSGSTRRQELISRRGTISSHVQACRKVRLQLGQFRQVCRIVLESIRQSQEKESDRQEFLNQEEEVVYYMGQIQKYLEKSYVDQMSCLSKPKKLKQEASRLSSLLVSNLNDKNIMSIYEQKDLLEFAKKNLQKMDVKGDRRQSIKKRYD